MSKILKAVENAIEFNKLVIVSVSKTASEKKVEKKDSFIILEL